MQSSFNRCCFAIYCRGDQEIILLSNFFSAVKWVRSTFTCLVMKDFAKVAKDFVKLFAQ